MKRSPVQIIFVLVLIGLTFWFGRVSQRNNDTAKGDGGDDAPKPIVVKDETPAKIEEKPAPITYTPEPTPLLENKDVPLLDRINGEYVKVTKAVLPSVVNVFTTKNMPADGNMGDDPGIPLPFGPGGPAIPGAPGAPGKPPAAKRRGPILPRDNSLGSGVIISREGHIVTNGHVVKDADEVQVQLFDNRRYTAKVIGIDEMGDIAVLKIDAPKDVELKALPWGDSSKLEVGEQVFAIGNPFGFSESVSTGIISAKGRNPGFQRDSYEDFLQTDAAINPGNSGGALVNVRGELIGINTAIASTNRGFQGIGFAIPSNLARFSLESLIKNNGRVIRGYLGVEIQDIKPNMVDILRIPSEDGALVASVKTPSPASEAKVVAGDVIVEINGKKIHDCAQVRLAVSQTPIGDEVKITVLRDSDGDQRERKELTAIVRELPGGLAKNGGDDGDDNSVGGDNALTGIKVQNIDEAARAKYKIKDDTKGVLVTAIDPGSVAEPNLKAGDVIQELRPKGQATPTAVPDVKTFIEVAKKLKPDQNVMLLVQRQSKSSFVMLQVK